MLMEEPTKHEHKQANNQGIPAKHTNKRIHRNNNRVNGDINGHRANQSNNSIHSITNNNKPTDTTSTNKTNQQITRK